MSSQQKSTEVDGVHRLSPTGTSIAVVGAGVGGLMFALEAWRQGHDVKIFEKGSRLDTIGDTFGILPPAWTTLRYFPTMKAEFEAASYDAELSLWDYNGEKLVHIGDASWNSPDKAKHAAKDVYVPWIETRYLITHMLTTQCERLGLEIHYAMAAVSYGETDTKAVVTLTGPQGKRDEEADIVVAADGVGTKSHHHVSGQPVKVLSSGYSVFRGIIPADVIKSEVSPRIFEKFFSAPRPEFRIYLCPPETHANIILTKDFFNYVVTYKDRESSKKDAKEKWTEAGISGSTVIAKLPNWDPDLLEMFHLIPQNSAIDWTLRWRDPQPQWTSSGGRVVQLGDSAHSFLPTSGNGATQACEDALSLATCLRIGASRGKLSTATKVHNKLRFERVSEIQKMGFKTRSMLHNADLKFSRKNPALIRTGMRMPEWIWVHDPVQYAVDNYDEAERHILKGTPFQNTNLPPGYTYVPWTVAGEMESEKQG
ncbi:FAD/NAD(P)-binding domain-containing protein [Xylariaceae sp. FL0255]|nr:FAD/NAD(P)-binding domain-containing protein [Xylariaceae sp. FL0255]